MSETIAADLRDHVTFDRRHAVRTRIHATDLLGVDLLCLEPGQVLSARAHDDADAWYLVIGGRAWVVTDDGETTLDPLQGVVVPAGTSHGIRNDSPDPLLLHVVSSLPVPLQSSSRGTRSNEPLAEPDGSTTRTDPA